MRARAATRTRRLPALALVLVSVGAAALLSAGPSGAQVAEVSGDAYGHWTKVGLFGGPQGVNGPDPMVTLPAKGSETPVTATASSGSAVYGPAHIFGGKWPLDVEVAPASGPLTVSTRGKPGPGGFVTSTADITLNKTPVHVTCAGQPPGTLNCISPGGFGPIVPNEGDELHSTCTANESGVSGSARFVNAILSTSTDESGEPKDREPIPEFPPPNYTRTGTITNVGDNWKIVYNEQFIDPDGSITVNALHMYLLGQIAVGDQILGHVRCSMRGLSTSPTTMIAASTKAPTTSPPAEVAAAPAPESDTDPGIVLLAAGVLIVGVTGSVLWTRHRMQKGEPLPADGP